MRRSLLGAVAVVAASLAGCVPSLHPLYTEQDLVFEPALAGEWSGKDTGTWAFTRDGEKAYRLVYADTDGKSGEFAAHLLKVQGSLYLDLFPKDPEIKGNDFYKAHFLPVHTFARVRQIEPTFQMAFLSADWIKKHVKEFPDAIRHETLSDTVILTAQPKDLQAFVARNEKTEGAFGEFSDMTRKTPAQP